MTYCISIKLDEGLVFLSDSRTNAGVDDVSTYRKMTIFNEDEDRTIVLMSSGNLAICQSIRQILIRKEQAESIWNASSLLDVAETVGEAIKKIHKRDSPTMNDLGVEFNCSFILGGQIKNEECRLFKIYSAGNFIEAGTECIYFQIGESKYGKPILDRVLNPNMNLNVAAKCALLSMDSTLRSNISVGLPLDLLVYEKNDFGISNYLSITDENSYFKEIRSSWGSYLREAFNHLKDIDWSNSKLRHSRDTYNKQLLQKKISK
ncbi:MAG: peptidase [Betaproteobacteria bacterium TMED41]|nr:MAG: peptidase [Betaproteobacteria bacterium TMED41]|tara:strand:+ start:381 stop:1166 length:786 start_codon:yes stop_codon:yes gene_type:complete